LKDVCLKRNSLYFPCKDRPCLTFMGMCVDLDRLGMSLQRGCVQALHVRMKMVAEARSLHHRFIQPWNSEIVSVHAFSLIARNYTVHICVLSIIHPSSFPRFETFQTFAGFIAGNISFGRAQLDTMLNAGQATKRCPQRRGNPSSYLMIIGRNGGGSSKSNVSNVF
jgi:hypothetical protein